MARALLIGCGCSARAAGGLLLERGWAVRGTSRSKPGLEAIAASGIEPAAADPDRVGSLVELLGDVTVCAWLLGTAGGEDGEALYGERLPSFLEKLVDTPVRGFVCEPRAGDGSDASDGREAAAGAARSWQIPVRLVDRRREPVGSWADQVADAVEGVVGLG